MLSAEHMGLGSRTRQRPPRPNQRHRIVRQFDPLAPQSRGVNFMTLPIHLCEAVPAAQPRVGAVSFCAIAAANWEEVDECAGAPREAAENAIGPCHYSFCRQTRNIVDIKDFCPNLAAKSYAQVLRSGMKEAANKAASEYHVLFTRMGGLRPLRECPWTCGDRP